MASYLEKYEGSSSNREEKFIRSVDSFLSQDHQSKELIVISDGCQKTIDILRSKYANEGDINLVKLPKQPLFSGMVRQQGLLKADGDIISYLDSVTGDRCVPLKINDKIDIVPLEDLFERFKFLSHYIGGKEVIDIPDSVEIYTITPDKFTKCDYDNAFTIFNNQFSKKQLDLITLLKNGLSVKEIAEIENQSLANIYERKYTIDDRFKAEVYHVDGKWTRIKKIIRHFVTDKETYKVTQKLGQTEITKDHSLVDIVNDKFIKVNFDIFKNKGFQTISTIPVKKINSFKLSDYINCSKNDLSDDKINSLGNDGHKFILNEYKDEDKILSFVRLIGFYIAEGSTSSRTTSLTWSLDNKKIEILNLLKKDIENISDVYTTIKKCQKDGYDCVYRLVTYNKLFTSIFPEICGVNARDKKIPSFIFSLDEKYIKEFIHYMYLGDGSFKQKNCNYTTISLKLISGLSFLLKTINIDHTIVYRKEKISWSLIERKDVVVRLKPKVFKVEKNIEPKFVYDIQVEDDNHIFVDACGCILLHNTDDFFGAKHLKTIAQNHQKEQCDWYYYNDVLRINRKESYTRNVELKHTSIGTSSIAHKNLNKAQWHGCNGYGHDWKFIENLIKYYPKVKKIYGANYNVCHVPNQFES